MIQENWPSFGALGSALAANYTLNFFQDLHHQVPLIGTWQGETKRTASIYVDNYNKNVEIRYRSGSLNGKIPAFSSGYIDTKGLDYIIFETDVVCYLPITLNTASYQAGFGGRGNAPAAGIDPLFAKVIGLYHFHGVNGDHSAKDFSADSGLGDLALNLPAAISDRYGVFGNTSAVMLFQNNISAQSASQALLQSKCTIEFFIAVDTLNAAHNLFTLCGNNFSINNTGVNFTIGAFGIVTLALPKNALYGVFHHIVFQVDNGLVSVTANGVAAPGPTAVAGYVNTGDIKFNSTLSGNTGPGIEGFYIDELRITNALRYDLTKAYVVPTAQFVDN